MVVLILFCLKAYVRKMFLRQRIYKKNYLKKIMYIFLKKKSFKSGVPSEDIHRPNTNEKNPQLKNVKKSKCKYVNVIMSIKLYIHRSI